VVCAVPPLVPVTVIEYVPVGVDELVVSVRVEDPAPLIDVGLNAAVVPVGRPDALSATDELKPPEAVVVMVLVPLLPRVTCTDVGEAEMVNDGAVTISETVAVCVIPPPVPVTVIEYVPLGVEEPAVSVSVEDPAPGAPIGVVLNAAVVPVGSPVALSAIDELKPPETVVVMVLVPLAPGATDIDVGEAEMVNTGVGTVRVTVAVCVTPPPVPVIVIRYEPAATEAPTATFMVELPEPGAAIDVGLKDTVTPVG